MPARSWDTGIATERLGAGGWLLQRAGLACLLATIALLACAASARADDGSGVADAVTVPSAEVSGLQNSPAQPGAVDQSAPTTATTGVTPEPAAGVGIEPTPGPAPNSLGADPALVSQTVPTSADAAGVVASATSPESSGLPKVAAPTNDAPTLVDEIVPVPAGAAPVSEGGAALAAATEPVAQSVADAPPSANAGPAPVPVDATTTTPAPTVTVDAPATTPTASVPETTSAAANVPAAPNAPAEPALVAVDPTVGLQPSSTPAPATETPAPTEPIVVTGPAQSVADAGTIAQTPTSVVAPASSTPAPATETPAPTEPIVVTGPAQPVADSTPVVQAPVTVVTPSTPVAEFVAPVSVAPATIEPAAETSTPAPARRSAAESPQPPIDLAPDNATTPSSIEPASDVHPTPEPAIIPAVQLSQTPLQLPPAVAANSAAESASETHVVVSATPQASDRVATTTATPPPASDLTIVEQATRGAETPPAAVTDPVRTGLTAPAALPPLATIEIVMADGSTTGKVRPTAMQLRTISFGLGISLERLSGRDGAISIRIDRAGHVTVLNGSGTRFTPSTTTATALIASVAAAVRFNSDATANKDVTAVDLGRLLHGPAPTLPAQTPVASGATWAPAGGPGQHGFGFGGGLGIAMAAFATGVVALRLGRRLGLTTEASRPVAFHSPLERPA